LDRSRSGNLGEADTGGAIAYGLALGFYPSLFCLPTDVPRPHALRHYGVAYMSGGVDEHLAALEFLLQVLLAVDPDHRAVFVGGSIISLCSS